MRTITQDFEITQSLRQEIKSTDIVLDILSGQKPYSDLVEYALHKEISDLQPDTALIAIAINAKAIADHLKDLPSPSMKILGFECERILEEYGPLWLENAHSKSVSPERALDLLVTIPDDLNSLVELLSLNSELISDTNSVESSILKIMSVQAASNALIAEEYIAALTGSDDQNDGALEIDMAYTPNDNIIQFPASA